MSAGSPGRAGSSRGRRRTAEVFERDRAFRGPAASSARDDRLDPAEARQQWTERGVRDDDRGARVCDGMFDVRLREELVEGHLDQTRPDAGEIGDGVLAAVSEQQRNPISAPGSQLGEPSGDAARCFLQIRIGEGAPPAFPGRPGRHGGEALPGGAHQVKARSRAVRLAGLPRLYAAGCPSIRTANMRTGSSPSTLQPCRTPCWTTTSPASSVTSSSSSISMVRRPDRITR